MVLAYSKIWLSNHLLDSDLPDDPYFASEVQRYFPSPMRKRYAREIPQHRLRREIVTTQTTNSLVNRMGPVFVTRAQEETGADPAAIARAYSIAREIFAMRALWFDIEALDNKVSAAVQYGMFYRAARLLRHTSLLAAARAWPEPAHREHGARVEARRRSAGRSDRRGARWPGTRALRRGLRRTHRWRRAREARAPHRAAGRCSNPHSTSSRLAASEKMSVIDVARVYFELGVVLGLDWLHTRDRRPVGGRLLAGHGPHGPARCGHARAPRTHAAGAAHARRAAQHRRLATCGARSARSGTDQSGSAR